MISEEKRGLSQNENEVQKILIRSHGSCYVASVIVQQVAVSASELEPEEIPFELTVSQLEVQDSLDPDEVVVANDIEIAYGDEFEVEVNLSGIDGVDESKMKILFHEAKNADGADFDTNTPDTYKAAIH